MLTIFFKCHRSRSSLAQGLRSAGQGQRASGAFERRADSKSHPGKGIGAHDGAYASRQARDWSLQRPGIGRGG